MPSIESSAFCAGPAVELRGARSGPLAGLRFAAKDNFDVAGFVTGAGNPDWAATHGPAASTAEAIRLLVDAGASLVGKTQMDELAWGAIGVNVHYGTPPNPAAPDRVPGGSSSGSASAVAAGLVDFALGTDSACSVRLPASYCGLYGIRPTHGRVSLDGVVPLSESLDTVGWFARDADMLARVGSVLLGGRQPVAPIERLLIAEDAFGLADPHVVAALQPAIQRLTEAIGSHGNVTLIESGPERGVQWLWFRAWSVEEREAWRLHGDWIETAQPKSRVLSRATFATAAQSTPEEDRLASEVFADLRVEIRAAIPAGSVLCIPTAREIAPLRAVDPPVLRATFCLMSIAGIGGLPQVTIPAGMLDGAPVGLSLVGPVGSDEALLELARRFGG